MDERRRNPPDPTLEARDEVATLFRLAGPRPRLAADAVAPVKQAARAAWRRQVRRRRRRIAALGVAAAGLVTVAGLSVRWLAGREPSAAPPVATVALRGGQVELGPGHDGSSAVAAGTRIATGESGFAALRLASGPSLRIDRASAVRVDSAATVVLERGALYLDSERSPAGAAALEVKTALGSVRHLGTQYEVRLLPGRLRVRVREGAVVVDGAGEAHEARAGDELTLSADGAVRVDPAPVQGPLWEWVERAAPPLEIEGVTLNAFLAWVARETGLPWRYASPDVQREARGVVLHGSVAGLTPEQALAVVLPGCGFHHRRLEHEFVLEPGAP